MKNIKLICIAATLLFSVLCHSNADPTADADTNKPASKFYCVGGDGVLAPGRFVYHEGITITNAIKMAGGIVKWARKSKVELMRKGQLPALVVDVSKIETGQATDVTIGPDDYIYVRGPTVIQRRWKDRRGA